LKLKPRFITLWVNPQRKKCLKIDAAEALKVQELIRRSKAVGMTDADRESFIGRLFEFQAEIETREAARRRLLDTGSWLERMNSHLLRRRKLAAAYIAGASLNQLATHERVTASSIQQGVSKEIPTGLRQQIAAERTASGKRRAPKWRPMQISAMLESVPDEEVMKLPLIVVAARMQTAAQSEQDTMESTDEDDPYLRDEAKAPTASAGE
jgi:hypothetical protein